MSNPARNDTRHDELCAKDASAEALAADYWQDLEVLSDAFNDMAMAEGYFRHQKNWMKGPPIKPCSAQFLALIRDGSDDLEAMRIIRASMQRYIAQVAEDEVVERGA